MCARRSDSDRKKDHATPDQLVLGTCAATGDNDDSDAAVSLPTFVALERPTQNNCSALGYIRRLFFLARRPGPRGGPQPSANQT